MIDRYFVKEQSPRGYGFYGVYCKSPLHGEDEAMFSHRTREEADALALQHNAQPYIVELVDALANMVGLADEAIMWRERSPDPEDNEMLDVYREQHRQAVAVLAKARGEA